MIVGEETELVVVQPPHYENVDLVLWLLSDCPKWELSNTTFPTHCVPTHLYTHIPITCHSCAHTCVQPFTCMNTCIPVHMYTYLFGHLCTCTAGKPCSCPPVHVPDCTPVYLPTCEPSHLSACVPAYLTTCISACLLTCVLPLLSICAPIHLYSSSPTYHCVPAYLHLHRYLRAHSPIQLCAYTSAHLYTLTSTLWIL